MSDFTLKIGGKEYPAKRVNIATLKKHREFLKRSAMLAGMATGEVKIEDAVDALVEMTQIVHACIQRAKADVTLEEIEEAFNQQELPIVFNQVMSGSGFAPSGEQKPASSQT